eukprot:gene32230-38982_t
MISETIKQKPSLARMLTASDQPPQDTPGDSTKQDAAGGDSDHEEGDAEEEGSVTSTATTVVGDSGIFGPYDSNKRDPRFAIAGEGVPALFELTLLKQHYHPSVRAFAQALLSPPHEIHFGGDPLVDFTLTAFLDRFVYRHPKKSVENSLRRKGRAVPSDDKTVLEEFGGVAAAGDGDEEDVAPDKQFFYRFFGERAAMLRGGKMRARKKKGKADGEEDGDGDGSEGEEEYAEKLAMDLIKSHEGHGDDGDWDEGSGSEGGEGEGWDGEDGLDGDEAVDLEDFKRQANKKKRGQPVDEDDGEDDDSDGEDIDWDAAGDGDSDDEGDDVAMLDDEDEGDWEDEEEEHPAAKKGGKGAKKGSKRKLADDDFDGDFAAAEDYEEQMEENVKAHSLEALEKELKQQQQKMGDKKQGKQKPSKQQEKVVDKKKKEKKHKKQRV